MAQAFLPAQGRQECLPHNDAYADRLDSKSGFLKESSENGKHTEYTDFLQRSKCGAGIPACAGQTRMSAPQRCIRGQAGFEEWLSERKQRKRQIHRIHGFFYKEANVAQAFLPAQGRQECLPHNDAYADRLDSKSGFLKESSENGKYTGYTDFLQRNKCGAGIPACAGQTRMSAPQRCIRGQAGFEGWLSERKQRKRQTHRIHGFFTKKQMWRRHSCLRRAGRNARPAFYRRRYASGIAPDKFCFVAERIFTGTIVRYRFSAPGNCTGI